MARILPQGVFICKYAGKPFMVIGDDVYEKHWPGDVRLRVHDLGGGHMEASGQTVFQWVEVDCEDKEKKKLLRTLRSLHKNRDIKTVQEVIDAQALSLEMSARRAKTRVRRLCKVMGADTLLTLTYRANVTDLAVCKAHLKEYVRRVRRVLPSFRAVAAFERQDRGAWHVHMATERFPAQLERNGVKLKSFNLLRAIWRSVTGEAGGNVDVSSSKRSQNRSAARIAAYISKYITKAFEQGEKWSNRWTKFGDCEVPKPIDLGIYPNMREAVAGAFGLIAGSASVVDSILGKWGDFFFLVVENNRFPPPYQ